MDTTTAIRQAVSPQRLLETAQSLVGIPSPTRSAGQVADRLAEILMQDGFTVERPVADWPEAPAVVVRFDSGAPGKTLQFDGHLDTVHLPFVAPRFENGYLYGSGASDMKGGIAAFVEALRALRDSGGLTAGGLLLTAHDHHEGPWGDRRQLYALIREGYYGDAVLLPEYLADRLPLAGRGMAIFNVEISRPGEKVHEVLRPPNTPDVLAAGAQLVNQVHQHHAEIKNNTHPFAGHDSYFIGQFEAGEIFNQSPTHCKIAGTRRWGTPGHTEQAEAEFRQLLERVAQQTNTQISTEFAVQGDAISIAPDDPIITAFQQAYSAVTGTTLAPGPKPFVDDGNSFSARAGIPALTHGPNATGAHTLDEQVSLDELVRVAQVYALTAVHFCGR
jgi:acetylornithine deacetylase/succinyl-diaminopimelate desuccinylase-like protein